MAPVDYLVDAKKEKANSTCKKSKTDIIIIAFEYYLKKKH